MPTPIEVFFSYSHADEELMEHIRRQLVVFERTGQIVKSYDRQIPAGGELNPEIDRRLNSADIILLFVSPDYLVSKYCWEREVPVAMRRHERGDAQVIPVILRPCAWSEAPFAKLRAVPKDGKPVTKWSDLDTVCLDIAVEITAVAKTIAGERANSADQSRSDHAEDRGIHRKKLKGDRIARILVPFSPPKAINLPKGYQPRLNQIAGDVARDSAVRTPEGEFRYPAQFQGTTPAVDAFVRSVSHEARLQEFGVEAGADGTDVWFEYSGKISPRELQEAARKLGLRVVHCGATLLGSMSS